MSRPDNHQLSAAELRRRAEAMALQKAQALADITSLSPEAIQKAVHELHVHQFQLEMQNDELRRMQHELDAARARYFDLYEQAPVGYLTLTPAGLILEANRTAASLLGVGRGTLARQAFTGFICREDQDLFYLERQSSACDEPHGCELRMVQADGTVFWGRLVIKALQQLDGHPVFQVILSNITERHQAAGALQESEARFRRLLSDVPCIAVQGYSPDGTTHYWNKASEQLYGYSAQEALGRNLVDLIIPPESREAVKQDIQQMAATGQTIPSAELSLLRKDGSRVDVFSSHTILPTIRPGQEQELFCIDIDLTDRKRVETALRESEERYRLMFDSAADAVFLIATDTGRIIKANRRASELYGYTEDELLTKQTKDLSAEPEETERLTQEARTTADQVIHIPLRRHRKKDGTVFPVEITARAIPLQGQPTLLVAVRDITIRKQMIEALRQSEHEAQTSRKFLELVRDTIPVRLFWKDTHLRYLGCNRLFAQDAGCQNPEALIGQDDYSLAWQAQADLYRRDDAAVMASCQPKLQYEEMQTRADGSTIWLSTSKVPLLDPHGEVIGVLGTYEDITQRKQQEEQLKAAKEDLERRVEQRTLELQETQKKYLHAEKLSAIGKLSASIAHEFNNPLQGILSILKGLRKRAILEPEDRELLEAAISESDRIKALIRSLQEFNRPSSGRKMAMDVHKSLNAVLLLHKSDFRNKKISLVLKYTEPLPQIFAVPDQIKQVFLNLLTNAADACQGPNGTVTIRTWQENDRVAVAIEDTGIGIQPEEMAYIFQPFYTTKQAVKGTGLGLSVSYGIIKQHQGEIRVESQPGQGTTFIVVLPIKGDDAAAAATSR